MFEKESSLKYTDLTGSVAYLHHPGWLLSADKMEIRSQVLRHVVI